MNDLISRQAAIDALMEEFKRTPTMAIRAKHVTEQLPSAEPDLITQMQNGIKATDADDAYSCGMRNGMRWCISLIDDKEPLYENCPPAQSKIVCCKDCKYFETDYWVNSILTHEICAICECAVKPDGYCFMAERREQ